VIDQLAINLAPRHPARQSDPVSSHYAAEEAVSSGLVGRQAGAVLQALRRFPRSTSRELSESSGIDRYAVGRRLSELRDAGLVDRDDGDQRKCLVAGRKACVWWCINREAGKT
jgi:predicted transcriptional regulator